MGADQPPPPPYFDALVAASLFVAPSFHLRAYFGPTNPHD